MYSATDEQGNLSFTKYPEEVDSKDYSLSRSPITLLLQETAVGPLARVGPRTLAADKRT